MGGVHGEHWWVTSHVPKHKRADVMATLCSKTILQTSYPIPALREVMIYCGRMRARIWLTIETDALRLDSIPSYCRYDDGTSTRVSRQAYSRPIVKLASYNLKHDFSDHQEDAKGAAQ
jgi:hypothetical protein